MDAKIKVIIPSIHIKKEIIEYEEENVARVAAMYHAADALQARMAPAEIQENTVTSLQVENKDQVATNQSTTSCQNSNHGYVKQNTDESQTCEEKFQDDVTESNSCAAQRISSSSDISSNSSMFPNKSPFKRQYRKGIPRSNELSLLLSKPFNLNWRREVVFRSPGSSSTADTYYITPGGKKLRSLPQVAAYLNETNETALSINSFTFHRGRISDCPNETERYARSWKKKSPSTEKIERMKDPKIKQGSLDINTGSTWKRTQIGAVTSDQDCNEINHTQTFLGHAHHGRQDNSAWSTMLHSDITPSSCMPSYGAQQKDVDYDAHHQWNRNDTRCSQQNDPQVASLPVAHEEKNSSEKYSSDYNVKCDAQHCLEPYGLLIWVECGDCGRWMHNVCIGLQSEQAYPASLIYKCDFCQFEGP